MIMDFAHHAIANSNRALVAENERLRAALQHIRDTTKDNFTEVFANEALEKNDTNTRL